jgi:iron complex transport system ATP-binding protein
MLTADGVRVLLDKVEVLHGVSMSVAPGEVVGLIGPNGAGKSTLIRTIAGLEKPRSGRVEVDGEDMTELEPGVRARRIGYLPQSSEVYWPVTVENLVALGRVPYRRLFAALGPEDRNAIEGALETMELGTLRDRSVGTLSGGERARVLVARMLAVGAPVLLADEPVAGLDPYHQIQLMDVFAAEREKGRAVVIVLHDLTLASRYCDRLILMNDGVVAADGDPESVLTSERIREVYRVEVLREHRDGALYVLPWVRSG